MCNKPASNFCKLFLDLDAIRKERDPFDGTHANDNDDDDDDLSWSSTSEENIETPRCGSEQKDMAHPSQQQQGEENSVDIIDIELDEYGAV